VVRAGQVAERVFAIGEVTGGALDAGAMRADAERVAQSIAR
jgi:hypothetical protein